MGSESLDHPFPKSLLGRALVPGLSTEGSPEESGEPSGAPVGRLHETLTYDLVSGSLPE